MPGAEAGGGAGCRCSLRYDAGRRPVRPAGSAPACPARAPWRLSRASRTSRTSARSRRPHRRGPLPAAAAAAATPSLAAHRIGFRTRCARFGGRALRRGLRLSRGGRSFCRRAQTRVLLVLLVLPSKPGQRVPLLVVARAGVRQPTGMPASRSGCRKPWPYSVGPRGAAYQCTGTRARRGGNLMRSGALRHRSGTGRVASVAAGIVVSGSCGAKSRPPGPHRAKPLVETRPGP